MKQLEQICISQCRSPNLCGRRNLLASLDPQEGGQPHPVAGAELAEGDRPAVLLDQNAGLTLQDQQDLMRDQ